MVRSLCLSVAVVTCVLFGTTLNRCLTCGEPAAGQAGGAAAAEVRGALLNPPSQPAALEAAGPAFAAPAGEPRRLPRLTETPGAPAEPRSEPKIDGEHLALTFNDLANYDYKYPEIGQKQVEDQIPRNIRELTERKIALQGFMIPIKNEGEDVFEFVLVRNQFFCCYGVIPRMNEWIHVFMAKGKAAPYAIDIPITCYGEFEVGEVWENGRLMSIYRLTCDKVVEPPTFR